MTDINLWFRVNTDTPEPEGIYFRGLSDRECNDPLNDGIYTALPYKARNTKPPHNGDSIPEVRKLENGDVCELLENIEWLWYWSWRRKVPSLPEDVCLNEHRKNLRGNAAFTNRNGSDTKRSWVLGTNPTAGPMRSEGVDCPGGNIYRAVDGGIVTKNGRACIAIWCVDYHWLKTLSVAEAKELAARLPNWLLHKARIVHSDGHVTDWDYGFTIPMMASKSTEQTAIIDGFRCRRNYMRASRLVRI